MAFTPKLFLEMSKLIASGLSVGHYEVRLAETEDEIKEAQNLRYEVLYKESGGRINKDMLNTGREEDEWDEIAYHVVVLDRKADNKVVGTVRLVSGSALKVGQSFYTEHAFDLNPMLSHYDSVLELSRACVSPQGRGGAILMLIWKFTMQFIEQNNYELLFGCASFSGTDYQQHSEILSYLYCKHLADAEFMPIPRPDVESIAINDFHKQNENTGKVPTLLRGYLKIGAKVSDHAIIDPVFNTTFVAIYVDVKKMFKTDHVLVNKAIK